MSDQLNSAKPLAVELKELSKRFGQTLANKNISLQVKKGSIHAIIGENGAGKSTAMNMLYGLFKPDHGEIYIHGHKTEFSSPLDAIANGLGMVHQHFMLSAPDSVLDNVILGSEKTSAFYPIPRIERQKELELITKNWSQKLPWNESVEKLPVGLQQRIEILKVLYKQADILILDEPTAVLTPQEANQLFVDLKNLKEQGKTILIITHKLREVMDLCDEVTVFRSGTIIATRDIKNTNIDELGELMVGKKIHLYDPKNPPPKDSPSTQSIAPLLEVQNLSLTGVLQNISFRIYPGEIVGLAGIQGNGQTELCQCLIQPQQWKKSELQGQIKVNETQTLGLSTKDIKNLGVGFISEDRLEEGLIPTASLKENFALGLHHKKPFAIGSLLSWSKISEQAKIAFEKFHVKTPSIELPASSLSGGNQQKVIMARELYFSPQLLIVSQPTRGVDIGAIELIHNELKRLQSLGIGILLISCELDEILALSNRVIVMCGGKLSAEFQRSECTETRLGVAMGGGAA